VLLAAAVLEEPSVETLRLALGRPISNDMEVAERSGVAIVDQEMISFAHPLFAAAIVSSATAAERRRTHRLLAAAVEESEQRARHLALAIEGRDEPTALVVDAAASDAFSRGAPTSAAELVQLALARGDQDTEAHQRRTLELAESLFAAGDAGRARDILKGVASWEDWPAKLQGRALARLCQLVCDTESPPSATAYLERLLRDAPGLGIEARAALLGGLSYSASEVDARRAARYADAALDLLEPLGDDADPWIHATALYMRLRARILLGEGFDQDAVNQICRVEARLPAQRRVLDQASRSVAYWWKHVDELEKSRSWLERNLREAIESGIDSGELNALVHLAVTECWAGRFDRAHDYAVNSCELADDLGARLPALLAAEALALVHAHLGNVEAVRAVVERQPAPSPLTRHGNLLFRAAGGLLELSLGDNEAADGHLRAGLKAAESVGCLEPGIHRMHANAAAAIALGDVARGEEIGIFLMEHGARTSHRWSLATGARVRALVATARRDLDAALVAIEQALEYHEQLDMPFEQARTLLVKGVVERRARQRGKAKESFERALAAFELMSASLWADRARAELGRVGLRRTTGAQLTQGERRVAELAARGLTNREVAAALFISPKPWRRISRALTASSELRRARSSEHKWRARYKRRERPDVTRHHGL
jgi:tetratricopeptide (TPR) repeat protein